MGESVVSEYHGSLDIDKGFYGFDNTYMYFGISVYSTFIFTNDGLLNPGFGESAQYLVRIGTDATGAGGFLLRSLFNPGVNEGVFDPLKAEGFLDTNGDVTSAGDGFDLQIIDDGLDKNNIADGVADDGTEEVLFASFTFIADGSAFVELAFNFARWNENNPDDQITPASLQYLVFETNEGLKANGNYIWMYEYTEAEAGSPYLGVDLGNVYELDTVAGFCGGSPCTGVPEPSTMLLFGIGLAGLGLLRKKSA